MNSVILLGVLAGVPVLLALLFRVSAVFLFLSMAAGGLLVNVVGDDAGLAAGMMVRGQNVPMLTNFALLFLPVAITLLFMRKTMPRSKFLLHIIPLVGVGLSLAVLALPLFASHIQQQIFDNRYGNMLKNAQDVIIAATAILTLLLMWLTYRDKSGKHDKHK